MVELHECVKQLPWVGNLRLAEDLQIGTGVSTVQDRSGFHGSLPPLYASASTHDKVQARFDAVLCGLDQLGKERGRQLYASVAGWLSATEQVVDGGSGGLRKKRKKGKKQKK